MISLDEALAAYSHHIVRLPHEVLPVESAHRRVLARTPVAELNLPRLDASAMDGYAVRTADAVPGRRLPVAGVAAPGPERGRLAPDTAARIYTGAPLPAGAEAVVPQERVDRQEDTVTIHEEAQPGDHIRRRGEELHAGAPLARSGEPITAGLLAALAMAGVSEVAVRRQPRIAVLVTGDEVRQPGAELGPADIADANGPLIAACLNAWGIEAPRAFHVGDRRETTEAALARAVAESDLVLTSGGASVGDRDFIPHAAQAVGVMPVFWKVAQKPGKPIFFGLRGDTAVLGLPGNPAAVLIGMLVHARRILDRMAGLERPAPRWRTGRLVDPQAVDHRRDRLLRMRATVDEAGTVRLAPLTGQASHMLGNLSRANALVRVPPGDDPLEAGTPVSWIPLPDTDLFTDQDEA